MGKLPAFQFYPGDWQKDPALNACDWKARAVWFSLLLVMHEAPQRGYLSLVDSEPMTERQLSNLTRIPLDELSVAMTELEESGVYSRDENGVIYSRRMLREEERRTEASQTGKKGGRPKRHDTTDTNTEPVQFDAPTKFPTVDGDRQPFGIERDALETGDILRIEAAFLAAWNGSQKVIKSGAICGSRLEREFWVRVSEPGWLTIAEQSLSVQRTDGGSLRLSKFLDGETPQAIIAGNYSFSSQPKSRKRTESDDKPTRVIEAACQAHRQSEVKRSRLIELEKQYRQQLDDKWLADVVSITPEMLERLDRQFPDMSLKVLEKNASAKTAHERQRKLYRSVLCEALERDDGGLSCHEWCEQRYGMESK